MTDIPGVDLGKDLLAIQRKWIEAERREQDLIYSREFAPAFIPLFAQLPLYGSPEPRPQFKALISVLGFSWQPVALMAAWANPEHILILGTQESVATKVDGEKVLDVLCRLSGIGEKRFEIHTAGDSDELGIYRKVQEFIEKYRLQSHEIAIDPTGGKKSMSVSAALAGFLKGAWIVYVDYGRYHSERRIPIAGTEYPRLLQNPLDVFGDLEFTRIKEAYRTGNYEEAFHLAEDLSSKLYQPREAQALAFMSKAYGAWHRFSFSEALDAIRQSKLHLEKFAVMGGWSWGAEILPGIRQQSDTLDKLSTLATQVSGGRKPETVEEGFPLVLNHFAAAQRALSQHQTGTAILLVYATLERYVDLCLWAYYRLDDEKPDFSNLELDQSAFHKAGRQIHGSSYQRRELTGSITLAGGVQLLSTLKPEILPPKFWGRITGIMSHRNKCEFEHGLCSKALGEQDVARHLETVKEILQIGLEQHGMSMDAELGAYRFPEI